MEKMSINQRIRKIIEVKEKGVNVSFAERIGKSRQQVSNFLKEGASVGLEIVNNIINTYPDINTDWLLSGEGKMLKSDVQNGAPVMDSDVMSVPLVSKYAHAGYLGGFGDDEYIEALPTVPFIVDHEGRGEYLCFEVRGDSMDDGSVNSYVEGEILLCREISSDLWCNSRLHMRNWDFVIVHREEGILVKEITDHNTENRTITIHSRNNFYEDQVLDLRLVKQIFNVVSSQRPRRK